MRFYKIVLYFFMLCASKNLVAQDVIIKKDSTIIYCRIIKEDDLTITYKIQRPLLVINKTDVLKYYDYASMRTTKKSIQDSGAKKKIIPKIDFSKVPPTKSDTLYLSNYGEFEYQQMPVTQNDVINIMRYDTLPQKIMKKSRGYNNASAVCSIILFPAIIVPFRITSLNFDTKAVYSGGALGAFLVIDIPVNFFYRKNAKRAIKLYNKNSVKQMAGD